MEPPVVNKPKVNITPKITKISSLAQSAEEIKKTSTKLRKTFESGAYQKKTQLTVLNRYKKRLDSIQKQNDKRFLKKQRVKIKLPEIKKFAGNFFTAGAANDPLKAIGALAAFNALRKGAKGDILGAIGPALVAGGIAFGPSLLKGGINLARRGKAQPQTSTPSGGGLFRGTPYAETKAGKAYASMQQFRNMPKWAQGLSRSSAGRFAASNERIIQGTANIGDKLRVGSRGMGVPGIGGIAENIAARGGGVAAEATTARAGGTIAAKAGGVGARAVPLLGTALNIGLSAYRFSQGDVVGGILSALSAVPVVGWAALGVDLAREFGAFDGTILGRKGQDKLKKQTEEQKKLVERRGAGGEKLTFGKSLNRYEKVVNKFEEFTKAFVGFDDHRAKGYEDAKEITPPPPPPGQNIVADTQVVQDAIDFRRSFPLASGVPQSSIDPYELQLRENDMLYKAGIGNDPELDRVHAQGSAHYSNRAIDIPVNNKDLGDRVAQFWRSKGYYVIWQAPGHYNHVHVQWNAGSAQESSISPQPQTQQQSLSPIFQKPQAPQGLTIGAGGFNVGGRPAASLPPRVTSPSRPSRSISQYTSYDPRGQMEQVIPVAIPIPQQQMMQAGGSESMMLPGPSEQDLLNSFYKRVLLNTVA